MAPRASATLAAAALLSLIAPLSAATDAELLLAVKASFANGNTVLANWQQGTSPCSGWGGVVCDNNGRVSEL